MALIAKIAVTFSGSLLAVLIGGSPAAAAPCSPVAPATLQLASRHGFDGDRVRLDLGSKRRSTPFIEYKVTGCELGAVEVPVTVFGLADATAFSGRLVSKSPSDATLTMDFDPRTMKPGEYDLSVATRDPALPLVQAIGLDVKDSSMPRPLATWFAACLLGVLVLAFRAAAASDSGWASWFRFFTKLSCVVPIGAGLASAFALLKAQVFDSPTWASTTSELLALATTSLGAMIAAGTVATAGTKAGAKTPVN